MSYNDNCLMLYSGLIFTRCTCTFAASATTQLYVQRKWNSIRYRFAVVLSTECEDAILFKNFKFSGSDEVRNYLGSKFIFSTCSMPGRFMVTNELFLEKSKRVHSIKNWFKVKKIIFTFFLFKWRVATMMPPSPLWCITRKSENWNH